MQALLVVGGTDPSGGAGLSQDVLQSHDAGVWACPVVSALTVQTPDRFDQYVPTDDRIFIASLEAAAASVDLAGVKSGYLATPRHVEYLAAFIRSLRDERPGAPVVVDPVGIPTAGQEAPERRAVLTAIADKLLPLATVVTPNVRELGMLADHPTEDALQIEVAAKRLVLLGAQAVHVKSAETDGQTVIDRFVTRYDNHPLALPRSNITDLHGGGCALATRLAAHLVRGMDADQAARVAAEEVAKQRLTARYGKSAQQALVTPQPLLADPEGPDAVRTLERAVPQIVLMMPSGWVAECGNNMAYAPKDAKTEREVAVLRQRIRLRNGHPHAPAVAWRPPSSHVARVALATAEVTLTDAAALNLRHVPEVFARAAAAGLTVGRFDRREEPAASGSSVEWGTRTVLERGLVDLVADDGGEGKEPMVRLLARDPDELVLKLRRLVAV